MYFAVFSENEEATPEEIHDKMAEILLPCEKQLRELLRMEPTEELTVTLGVEPTPSPEPGNSENNGGDGNGGDENNDETIEELPSDQTTQDQTGEDKKPEETEERPRTGKTRRSRRPLSRISRRPPSRADRSRRKRPAAPQRQRRLHHDRGTIQADHRGGRQGLHREDGPGGKGPHDHLCRGARPAGGLPRRGQDDAGHGLFQGVGLAEQADPVHARYAALGHHGLYHVQPGEQPVRVPGRRGQLPAAAGRRDQPDFPKTQSALLEVMQEHTITVDGKTHALPTPFLCIATQNPWVRPVPSPCRNPSWTDLWSASPSATRRWRTR